MTTRRAIFWAVFILAMAVAMWATFGCVPTETRSTLQQQQRESVYGRGSADVTKTVEANPANVTISATDKAGLTVKVEQPVQGRTVARAHESASETSDSHASGAASSEVTIPAFVKIIGLCLALLLVLFVLHVMRRNAAVRGVTDFASSALNTAIDNLRTHAAGSTNPDAISAYRLGEAELERTRADVLKGGK